MRLSWNRLFLSYLRSPSGTPRNVMKCYEMSILQIDSLVQLKRREVFVPSPLGSSHGGSRFMPWWFTVRWVNVPTLFAGGSEGRKTLVQAGHLYPKEWVGSYLL